MIFCLFVSLLVRLSTFFFSLPMRGVGPSARDHLPGLILNFVVAAPLLVLLDSPPVPLSFPLLFE